MLAKVPSWVAVKTKATGRICYVLANELTITVRHVCMYGTGHHSQVRFVQLTKGHLLPGMGRTGSKVPAVHTSPRKIKTCKSVTDWRSYFYDSGIVRTCTEDLYRVPGPPIIRGLVDWGLVVI